MSATPEPAATPADAPTELGNGALFRNERKDKPQHPDYRGVATLSELGDVRIAGWVRKSRAGDTYLSLAFRVDDRDKDTPAGADVPDPADNTPLPF